MNINQPPRVYGGPVESGRCSLYLRSSSATFLPWERQSYQKDNPVVNVNGFGTSRIFLSNNMTIGAISDGITQSLQLYSLGFLCNLD